MKVAVPEYDVLRILYTAFCIQSSMLLTYTRTSGPVSSYIAAVVAACGTSWQLLAVSRQYTIGIPKTERAINF